MKLKKAIQIGKDILYYTKPSDPPEGYNAIKLLIEAGELEIKNRGTLRPGLYPLLPGETEE